MRKEPFGGVSRERTAHGWPVGPVPTYRDNDSSNGTKSNLHMMFEAIREHRQLDFSQELGYNLG